MLDFNLKGLVADFAAPRGLSKLDESMQFGAFVTHLLFRKYHRVEVNGRNIENYVVDGGGDGGIDSIGIFVNGTPVLAKEDLERFIARDASSAEVEFVFIQAKTASKFKARDIGDFGHGVEQFFEGTKGNEPQVAFNDSIRARIAVAKAILEAPYREKVRGADGPRCFLYFAAAGKWRDGHDPARRLEGVRQRISKMDLPIKIEDEHMRARAIDKDDLATIERDLRLAIKKIALPYESDIAFPQIQNVEKAHIVLMPAKAFIQLVSTDDDHLNERLFYENLRDFQGDNDVNSQIRNTLASEQTSDSFPLLNNGITIVARDLHLANKQLDVSDYQIVNGCQTTHVLFQNRERIDDSVFVPVKFVVALDRRVTENVITATNMQTEVKPETFVTLQQFHKDLEENYRRREEETVPESENRVYYERRFKQYVREGVNEDNIIDLEAQTLSFIAMFAEAPHYHEHNYGELLKGEYKERLFGDHQVEPYYASGVALVELERWLRGRPDPTEFRLHDYKYHLLMLAKLSVAGRASTTMFNRRDVADYALRVVDEIRDARRGQAVWQRAVDQLKAALELYQPGDQAPHKEEAFTDYLLREGRSAGAGVSEESTADAVAPADDDLLEKGTILWFDAVSRYGRIKTQGGRELFVDSSEINAVPPRLRTRGTQVVFEIGPAPVAGAQMTAMEVKLDE